MRRDGEQRAAREFLSREQPRGRRGSISQIDLIHSAPPTAAAAVGRTAAEFEALRSRSGAIRPTALTALIHPTQELPWDPARGGGRRQIRTGRNFQVPDAAHPGHHFVIRMHSNDLARTDPREHAFSHAVVRVQRSFDGAFLLAHDDHHQAWGTRPDQANEAHIPLFPGRRGR